jgi:RNA polymerase sigma-70 factor (ECF subfamily)
MDAQPQAFAVEGMPRMAPTAPLKPLARAVLGTQSDARLVKLTREGSEDAFAEIVRRHRPGLLRFARSLGSGERSEDVVQDGLVRAWKALRNSDAEIDLRPWLTTIVRNRALSAHASVRYHEELDETIDGVRQPGDYALLHEELRSAVSAVNSLPEAQRVALVRSALDGESHETIAAVLDTTPGAVRLLIFRARTGLRDGLGALVPLPAIRWLVEATTHEAAAGGAATGSAAAIAAGAGGGSLALKAVAVIAVGAAVAGSGIAIERDRDGGARNGGAEEAQAAPVAETAGAHQAASQEGTATSTSTGADAASTASPERSTGAADDAASRTTTLGAPDSTASESTIRQTEPGGDQPAEDTTTPPPTDSAEPAPNGSGTPTQTQQPPPAGGGGHHQGGGSGGDQFGPGGQTQTQQPPPPLPDDGQLLQPQYETGTGQYGGGFHDNRDSDGDYGSTGFGSGSYGSGSGASPHP